ncbi:M81 family metallopeptidase [Allosediminivita pacifica]|uniref:Microcystin degradation protein MlrC n=1 Tax=Allosediminivita pacifica TaxID=1267769 RepID=A0A2T6AJL4_9RHOB|nr:M81 family metallopeptidase [Allosediminivita pacifica]PTX43966.1 microcystin degradation protein MlrC [Allosediminivita pacifica]GGB21282.1 microcystinase C [Allosediminivita pacifica]
MRVALAGFLHETNTFAPVPADLAAFETGGGYIPMSRGEELVRRSEGVNLGIASALAAARRLVWDIAPILWAGAIPSAPVSERAFEQIAGEIVAGLTKAGPLDGVFLDLHGAMVADHVDDGELEIAKRVRAVVGPTVPIVAALDLHGNISEEFARCVDGLVGFRTYPHVDMAETGTRAADLLHRMMSTGSRPACAFRRMGYLVPIPFQTTDTEPGRALYAELAKIEEADGDVLATSLFMGFPAADIPDCGPTAIVYAESTEAAERAAERLALSYADAEDRFAGQSYSADEAVQEARDLAGDDRGPVVIADTQDNPGAGGVSATTGMLRALIAAGAEDAALGLILDPETARAAHAAGAGVRTRFRIGGHAGVPGDTPVETEAMVETLSDGKLRATGPYYGGTALDLGPSVCLRIGGVRVVVTSRIAQMADREMFRFVGITPETQKILVVKSSTHFRADFAPIASDILVAIAPGPMPLDPVDLPFTRLRPELRLSPNGPAFGDLRAQTARPDTGARAGVQHHQDVIQQGRHT